MSTIASNPLSTPGASGTGTLANPKSQLNATDFINMMVTQLENQDPLQPESNSDLMGQMSQIGQLQASTQLQSTLTSLGLQTNIGAAGNLIGKMVQGLDSNGAPLSGIVDSVKVANSTVSLELDNGSELAMSNLTSVSPAPTTPATATTGTAPTATTPTATGPLGN
jgi:flagellar basal-body rod modification protein FlgD